MSRRSRRRAAAPPPGPGGPRFPRWLAVTLGLLAGGLAALVLVLSGRDRALPRARTPAAPAVSFEDFLGSDACADCHAQAMAEWRGSTHARAGGPPDSVDLLVPFDGRPIRFRDATVTPRRTVSGAFVFQVAHTGGAPVTHDVYAVIGGGHMAGGGTQGFVTRFPDGTVRFLPFDYSAAERTWFCNTIGRANRGWAPITPDLALADCADWPPQRVLGDHPRLYNCQQCHGSQIQLVELTGTAYSTRQRDFTVNCESCHGPGRPHVERIRSGANRTGDDLAMEALEALSEDASLAVCFRCHALKTALAPGYLPGDRFAEFYSVKLPILIGAPFFPDGRVRTFAYQENHLASDCYVSGRITCTDCHDPHRQTYRDPTGIPLEGRLDDGQCLGCHPSKIERPEAHTRHRPGSAGSRCVACHMPYLQHPLVGTAVRYARADHTISIPRPDLDAALGIRGACVQCHPDRPAQVLAAQVETWYGPLKPMAARVTALMRARARRDRAAAAALVLQDDPQPQPLARFAGMSHLFIQYLGPDLPDLEPEIVAGLRRLSDDPDDDVAALALASLHLARGHDRDTRRFLAERLETLGERETAVRRRWREILAIRARSEAVQRQAETARRTYRKVLELDPEDPEALGALGRGRQ